MLLKNKPEQTKLEKETKIAKTITVNQQY